MPAPDAQVFTTATTPEALTTAIDIVRFTHRSARRYKRSRLSVSDLFVDVYSNVLGAAVALALAGSFVWALRNEIAGRASITSGLIDERWLVLPTPLLWACLTFMGLFALSGLARKLGPIAVSGPESIWWLSLPVDRRPMVLPPFLRKTVLTGIGAAFVYLPFSILTAAGRAPVEHAYAALTFGAAGTLAVSLAAALQLGLLPHHRGRVMTDRRRRVSRDGGASRGWRAWRGTYPGRRRGGPCGRGSVRLGYE